MDTASISTCGWDNSLYPPDVEEDGVDALNSNPEIYISEEDEEDAAPSTSKPPSRKRSMETEAQGSPKRASTPHPNFGYLNPSEDTRIWVEQTQSEIISGVTPVSVSLVLLWRSLIINVI